VAIFLSSLFPSLSTIYTPTFSLYRLQWKEVETLVPVYAKIRADERQFGTASHSSPPLPESDKL
jgi:hypothetical protein